MLQLRNRTPFAATFLIAPDPDGVDVLTTVVKGTFALGTRVTVADEQLPPRLGDKYLGEPGQSSIAAPSDIGLAKPSTDVLLLGSAWAPRGSPTWQHDVSLRVGSVTKTVRVFGDRVWDAGPGGAAMAWVSPFERLPLVWERAFGGADQTERGPAADPRNPVGAGFRAPGGVKPLSGMPLPNIEDPAALISGWKDAPAPAGVAPVAPHWEPRKSYAGTYDEAWQQQRSPYLPSDFSPRFFQVAPSDLVASNHLQGGEPVEVIGATPDGALRFRLPEYRIRVAHRVDNDTRVEPASLDTVIIEPDASRVTLVWRSSLRCDKKALRVRDIQPFVAWAAEQ